MMTIDWKDVNFDELTVFCNEWRTREDIKEKFFLDDVSSWKICRRIMKFSCDFMVIKKAGFTRRAYRFKGRQHAISESKEALNII